MKMRLIIAMMAVILATAGKVRAEIGCNLGVLITTIGPGVTAGCEKGRFGLSIFSTQSQAKTGSLEVKTQADQIWSAWKVDYHLETEASRMIAILGDLKVSERLRISAGAAQLRCGATATGRSEIRDMVGNIQPWERVYVVGCPDRWVPLVKLEVRIPLSKRISLVAGAAYLWLQPLRTSLFTFNDVAYFEDGVVVVAPGRQEVQDAVREETEISSVVASVTLQFRFF